MPRPLEVSPRLPRPEPQRYAECAAQGCTRTPRSFSRFCSMHARRFHRTRDPNGRVVRVGEIKPYAVIADDYLKQFAEHPAVVAAVDFFRVNLSDPTMPADIRRQLQRLQRDCAEPRAMLVNFLAVWGLRHYLPHTVTTDACEAMNLGSRVLRTSPLPTIKTADGKRNPVRLPPRVCEGYGLYLRRSLGVFAMQFWSLVQRQIDAPAAATRAINDALRITPLFIPDTL
jgi:hypothetical protein